MSINSTITNPCFGERLAGACVTYQAAGCSITMVDRCVEYTMRYMLAAVVPSSWQAPSAFHAAVCTIASRLLPDRVSGKIACPSLPDLEASSGDGEQVDPASVAYWTSRVASTIGMTTWLDDSLGKWYLDTSHPMMDVLLQASRRRAIDAMMRHAVAGEPIVEQDLVATIVSDLLKRMPALGRFSKHLPATIATMLRTDVLGVPIDDEEIDPVPMSGPLNGTIEVMEPLMHHEHHEPWRMEEA